VFLGIKAEYAHSSSSTSCGPAFPPEGPHAQFAQLFFSFYFAMTGVHALHMIVGVGLWRGLLVNAFAGSTRRVLHPVECRGSTGTSWIRMVFLFPTLYLVARHA